MARLRSLLRFRLISPRRYRLEKSSRPLRPSSAAKAAVSRTTRAAVARSEEHTSELQSPCNLVCRLLLEKKKKNVEQLGFPPAHGKGVTLYDIMPITSELIDLLCLRISSVEHEYESASSCSYASILAPL